MYFWAMSKKLPLSVIIITKNEEKLISACLESVSFAEDIVVLDAGSKDNTTEIAKSFGCRVFVEEWKGYGPQKQSALEKTYHKWVLSLDADERIPPETAQIISQIIQDPKAQAYSLPRKNFFHGKWIKHSGWWPDRVVRLFDKEHGKFEGIVHETWVTEGKIIELNVPIEHYSYQNYSQMLKKMNEYSSTRARELYDKGIRVNLLTPFLHGGWMFIRSYFLKLGLLNGLDGFIISFINACNSFFKYAKLLEMQKPRKTI